MISTISLVRRYGKSELRITSTNCRQFRRKYGILDVPELPPSELMDNFTLVNYKDVIKLVTSSPSKSCKQDPIPTDLPMGVIAELAPLIAAVNSSLDQGIHTKRGSPKTIVKEDQPGSHQQKLQIDVKPGISWQADWKVYIKANHKTYYQE